MTAADRQRERNARRNERLASDPVYREAVNRRQRNSGLRHRLLFEWIPRWRRILGPTEEAAYLRRCSERTRYYYNAWKHDTMGIIARIIKGASR